MNEYIEYHNTPNNQISSHKLVLLQRLMAALDSNCNNESKYITSNLAISNYVALLADLIDVFTKDQTTLINNTVSLSNLVSSIDKVIYSFCHFYATGYPNMGNAILMKHLSLPFKNKISELNKNSKLNENSKPNENSELNENLDLNENSELNENKEIKNDDQYIKQIYKSIECIDDENLSCSINSTVDIYVEQLNCAKKLVLAQMRQLTECVNIISRVISILETIKNALISYNESQIDVLFSLKDFLTNMIEKKYFKNITINFHNKIKWAFASVNYIKERIILISSNLTEITHFIDTSTRNFRETIQKCVWLLFVRHLESQIDYHTNKSDWAWLLNDNAIVVCPSEAHDKLINIKSMTNDINDNLIKTQFDQNNNFSIILDAL